MPIHNSILRLVLLCCLLFASQPEAQTKLSHWGEVPKRYVAVDTALRKNQPAEWTMSNLLVVPYRVFISDVDGDHCPFTPTCSAFFVDACRQTNIFQGTLMFVDRFTRDSNTFDRAGHYPTDTRRNRLIDPASNYRLRDSLIIVKPQQ
jgi:putative component of membrane protein insertase Oxa1/YidC/SpoIIIJ protein YidD